MHKGSLPPPWPGGFIWRQSSRRPPPHRPGRTRRPGRGVTARWGLSKVRADTGIPGRFEQGGGCGLAVAGFGRYPHRLRQLRQGNQIDILRKQGAGKEVLLPSQCHRACRRVFGDDETRLSERQAEALALADGIVEEAPVGAYRIPPAYREKSPGGLGRPIPSSRNRT